MNEIAAGDDRVPEHEHEWAKFIDPLPLNPDDFETGDLIVILVRLRDDGQYAVRRLVKADAERPAIWREIDSALRFLDQHPGQPAIEEVEE